VSGAAVEEDLGDFCGVWGDFDDVGVSPAGTAASQRAFSAHCLAASLENMNLRSAEAVECYPGAMEERSNTSWAVMRLWLKRRRTRFHQRITIHFYRSAGL
jgi:hypothetical protein